MYRVINKLPSGEIDLLRDLQMAFYTDKVVYDSVNSYKGDDPLVLAAKVIAAQYRHSQKMEKILRDIIKSHSMPI